MRELRSFNVPGFRNHLPLDVWWRRLDIITLFQRVSQSEIVSLAIHFSVFLTLTVPRHQKHEEYLQSREIPKRNSLLETWSAGFPPFSAWTYISFAYSLCVSPHT